MRTGKIHLKYLLNLLGAVVLLFAVSCDLLDVPLLTATPTDIPAAIPTKQALTAEGLGLEDYSHPPSQPITDVTFQVKIPENTPLNQIIYLILRDEVTGLALNTESYPLESVKNDSDPEGRYFAITLQFPLGSLIKYRYERQTDTVPVAEHNSDDKPVRYRLYHVEGPGEVNDVISKWTDTDFIYPTGRILGVASDVDTGEKIPNLLITAGGSQTISSSDGSFLLEGLPDGTHNLVAISMDGSYQTFQQGARVAGDSTTPAEISLKKAALVNFAFISKLPDDTPPIVPVRISGSLFQLGNTFGDLAGGMSSIATNMPVLTALPDGRFLLRTQLPVGADIRYKYTLGDGFWNAEHSLDGEFIVRQVVVPENDTVVIDQVETWRAGDFGPITFDIVSPENTPVNDTVSIQFDPAYGWTTPIPMWALGGNRWAYILYSPLNLPGDLHYRFCRNGQCNRTDDVRTVGEKDPGFPIPIGSESQVIVDTIPSWSMFPEVPPEVTIITPTIPLNTPLATTGIELEPAYHPSYRALFPNIIGEVSSIGPDIVMITPTWSFSRQSPPALEPVPGKDANWIEINEMITQTKNQARLAAIYPTPLFPFATDDWWNSAARDFSWWLVWFEQYGKFSQHHADLANLNGASTLVLGGSWLDPSLPDGKLSDGSPSGVPADAEDRWRTIISNVRARFAGNVIWALPMDQINEPPSFLDSLDGIYLLWDLPLSESPDAPVAELQAEAERILDSQVLPLVQRFNKPVLVGISYPSAAGSVTGCALTITGNCVPIDDLTTMNPEIFNLSLNLQEQINAYTATLSAINNRSWISGIFSRGYYQPAELVDPGLSSHGKPLDDTLQLWFSANP